ncbi:16S rRNA (cytosine(967)-C(5))-methyltransferase RsmB [Ileibacterium valens]|uniref:16S rRNA (cytosine(967)-C(5))-methyltransferase RsmB n=1 Tax=Ileibacterium valens TaxID=1862668 RepID=UPI0024BB20BB|nr:16S rRNA (cytosine(967)-C(5))-methyltransferase RsmB [Ileibacterium valens]
MREWLWNALCEVVLHQTYSNLYLKNHLQELPEKDRALASRIFYGTLQNYVYCKAAWQRFAKTKVSGKLQVLLTFSTYQLLFLDKVPEYAVINDAVDLVKKNSSKQASFINAILRKVTREYFDLPEDEIKALALETSLPEWLVKMWKAQYSMEEAKAFAEATLDTLPVYAAINPTNQTAASRKEIESWQKVQDGLYVYPKTSVANDPLYREGRISILDPGSYAIALYGNPSENEKVLDLCAAPGSKTMIMAEQMNNSGHIDAYDLHEHRARLIEQDMNRLHLSNISAKAADSTMIEPTKDYDLVLCDVPCTGYGVLARKPDMKLRLNPEDMDQLIPLQAKLLEKGSEAVKTGGRLVYSTCTLNKKENEKQVEKFLKNHPDFELDEQQTLYPDGNHDGFYMARMIRKK